MGGTCSNGIDEALARAVVYHFLAVGFQPPGAGSFGEQGFGRVAEALRLLAGDRRSPLAAVADRVAALEPPSVETVENGYARLFGHTARGLVCACETEYGSARAFQQPQQLADLAGTYLAFGLRPAHAFRVDHIACECEFMDFLSRKEAVLLSAGESGTPDDETLDVTRRAAREFLRDHLGRFGRAFATRLVQEAPDPYFATLGHVLLAWLDAECARFDIDPGPIELPLCPPVEEVEAACGTACGPADPAPQLIQIQRQPSCTTG